MLGLRQITEKSNTRGIIRNNADGALRLVTRADKELDRDDWVRPYDPELSFAIQSILGGETLLTHVRYVSPGALRHAVNLLPKGPFDPLGELMSMELQELTEVAERGSLPALVADIDLAVAHDLGVYLLARLGYPQE